MAIANQQDTGFFLSSPSRPGMFNQTTSHNLGCETERDVLTFTEYATCRDLSQTKTSAPAVMLVLSYEGTGTQTRLGSCFSLPHDAAGARLLLPRAFMVPWGHDCFRAVLITTWRNKRWH